MKTETLKEILNHFKFVFNSNNFIEEANYIVFNPEKNSLSIYSDTIQYRYHYDGNMAEDFSLTATSPFGIDAKKFFGLINKTKQEDVKIKQNEDGVLVVRLGRSTTKFKPPSLNFKPIHSSTFGDFRKFPCTSLKPCLNYFKFDKADAICRNLIVKENAILSTDRWNIVKWETEDFVTDEFGIQHDCFRHAVMNGFESMMVEDNLLIFMKAGYKFICKNTLDNTGEVESQIDGIEEEVDLRHNIKLKAEEDISFIDALLADYKKLDKKVKVSIQNSERGFVCVEEGDIESRTEIKVESYPAEDPISFKITVDYFKDIYNDYDTFCVLDNVLYCENEELGIKRVVTVGGVK